MSELMPAPDGYPIKLVRDKIEQCEQSPWLRKKLIEEIAEYVIEPGLDELADVLAVVEALAHVHGRDLTTLREVMDADPRGGFFTGRMMRGHHPDFDGVRDPEQEHEG